MKKLERKKERRRAAELQLSQVAKDMSILVLSTLPPPPPPPPPPPVATSTNPDPKPSEKTAFKFDQEGEGEKEARNSEAKGAGKMGGLKIDVHSQRQMLRIERLADAFGLCLACGDPPAG